MPNERHRNVLSIWGVNEIYMLCIEMKGVVNEGYISAFVKNRI